ncbi:hypothetical protein P5673_030947 [Acropora cervicornis]|uniref:Uncharacterized protein n=1 Tax=Acropora cervicornis TaxID=6130 RepID=A0AAD9PTW6_ACRCE|nr:hypothetical protein P5673_030947 [Acropora cervicornis]
MQGHMRFDTLVIMTNTWLYRWVVEETFVALGNTPRYLPTGAELDTDLGSENGTMAVIQAFFRDDENTLRFVSSL